MTAIVYRNGIEGYHWTCQPRCPEGENRALVFEARDASSTTFQSALGDQPRPLHGARQLVRPLIYGQSGGSSNGLFGARGVNHGSKLQA